MRDSTSTAWAAGTVRPWLPQQNAPYTDCDFAPLDGMQHYAGFVVTIERSLYGSHLTWKGILYG